MAEKPAVVKKINSEINLLMNNQNDIVKLDNVYYDLNEYYIRPDASIVLDKVVDMMKLNPGMKIELRSHTDCRQTESYNYVLSIKRAKAAMSYLVENGISKERLTANGYGESIPINVCDCTGNSSASCTEAEYQQNRRTEFKILTLK